MSRAKESMDLLGLPARDRVTGLEGVITTVSFDLYGCIQVVITPPANEDGKLPSGVWLDTGRVKVLSTTPVMHLPDFELEKGPAEKPAM